MLCLPLLCRMPGCLYASCSEKGQSLQLAVLDCCQKHYSLPVISIKLDLRSILSSQQHCTRKLQGTVMFEDVLSSLGFSTQVWGSAREDE